MVPKAPSQLPPSSSPPSPPPRLDLQDCHPIFTSRPRSAHGTFLRILTINDVYTLDNYPRIATAVAEAKAAQATSTDEDIDSCVVVSVLVGDFLSPCVLTALDRGRALMEGLNLANIDYVMLGNHEFDLGFDGLQRRLSEYRGIVLNSNVDDDFMKDYPKYELLDVGNRTVALSAYLTDQMDIYPPHSRPTIRPVHDTILETWEAIKKERNGIVPDAFIPLTHQLLHQDRAMCTNVIAKHPELRSRTPVVLGGHDHEVYIEEAGSKATTIVKVGIDAEQIGIVDVWWDKNNNIQRQITLLPITEFDPDPTGWQYVKSKKDEVTRLLSTPIAVLPQQGSTGRVRFEGSYVASWLLSILKTGLSARAMAGGEPPIDVVLMQAGAIRGSADYVVGPFTLGDLYNELAFDTPMGIVHHGVPGYILAETVRLTRSAPKPAPQFVHLDLDCIVVTGAGHGGDDDGQHVLTHINGQPIEPDRLYKVATWNNTLLGVNDIQPFLGYVQQLGDSAVQHDEEGCPLAKEVVLETCVVDAWRVLFGLHQQLPSLSNPSSSPTANVCSCVGTGLTKVQVMDAIDRTFNEMDADHNGIVEIKELYQFMEKKGHSIYHGCGIAMEMMKLIDIDKDGKLTKDDILDQLHISTCHA